ncbi:MAG: hypothetical protein FJ213_13370 [Ignavibacteria bacterium]|nr:hypothetical protein [Ignavibacteria bacterium]
MSKKTKIWLVVAAVFLFVVVVFVGFGIYVGAFSSVEITEGYRGPYDFVYTKHKGPYQLVSEKIKKVETLLKEKNIEQTIAAGRYYDDPATTPKELLRSDAGVFVSSPVQVEPPLYYEQIVERYVIIGKIKAHPAIAPFKTYPAINEYIELKGYTVTGPAFEIYNEDGSVEVHLPVSK